MIRRIQRQIISSLSGDISLDSDWWYNSNFRTADTDGWAATRMTRTSGVNSISDGTIIRSGVLSAYCSADNNTHSIFRNYTMFTASDPVLLIFDYYIPSTNTNLDGFSLRSATGGTLIKNISVTGAWTREEIEISSVAVASTDPRINILGTKAGAVTFAGAGSPTDDIFYIQNWQIIKRVA